MQLFYETYGDGYPLIILHGLFGSLENWRTLSRLFSRCYRVFALDQRNHGRSPHSEEFNYPALAQDVREFMERQRLSSAYVLGHSMGGKTAMQLALAYPERVDKLVVVDIAPKAYPHGHDAIFDALGSIRPAEFHRRKDVDAALAGKLPDEALRQFLLKNLVRKPNGAFEWGIGLDEIRRHYAEIAQGVGAADRVAADRGDGGGRFEKPTLFIRGARSEYIGERDREAIKRLFPYSRLVTVPGVGHWIHVEARRRFARIVLTFLGQ